MLPNPELFPLASDLGHVCNVIPNEHLLGPDHDHDARNLAMDKVL